MVGVRLSAGQGSDLWTRQTGKETVSCFKMFICTSCQKETTGEDSGKILAACYHSTVQYIDVSVCAFSSFCPAICVCRGRPGQRDRKCWCIRVISCLCNNKLKMVMTHT